jgi:hypothetical protein
MPDLSDPELAHRVESLRPGPFDRLSLLRAVRALLDQPAHNELRASALAQRGQVVVAALGVAERAAHLLRRVVVPNPIAVVLMPSPQKS